MVLIQVFMVSEFIKTLFKEKIAYNENSQLFEIIKSLIKKFPWLGRKIFIYVKSSLSSHKGWLKVRKLIFNKHNEVNKITTFKELIDIENTKFIDEQHNYSEFGK